MENPGFASSADKLVLIVDDEKGIRELLEIVVRREGFRAELSEDGEDALNKARTLSPDIIILDLMLPKSGGFEVLHELQAEETANIPIIVITGRNMDRSTADMIRREANVREYIEKPLKTEVLAARLHQLLKTRPPARKPGK
ncbi:MAG: response regulator [Elusimicrobiota bacterium]|nr:response regulator [Elusimicrobiota bacterium]